MANWDLKGKRALITGGTKGIGKAIAEEFLALGAEVIVVARNKHEVDELVEVGLAPKSEGRNGPTGGPDGRRRVSGVAGDITNPGDRQRIGEAIEERWGALDTLVNNAGTNIRRKLADYSEEEIRQVIELNLFGAIALCRLCLPFLMLGTGASVVNISSVAGSIDIQTGAPYGMSKAALIQLSRSLAVEWAEHGIRVNTVSPWYTDTPLVETVLKRPDRLQRIIDGTPLSRVAQPEEVASAVAFLAMDKASYITGIDLPVDGGMLSKGL
jgi:Tropinone reductase 1